MTNHWGGGRGQGTKWWIWSSKQTIHANKENTWRTGQHLLINNQWDKHASVKTKVDFNLKLAMDLQLQGSVGWGVLGLFSLSLPLGTMLIKFLTRKAYFIPAAVRPSKLCNPVYVQRTSNGKLTLPLSPVGDHKAASPFPKDQLRHRAAGYKSRLYDPKAWARNHYTLLPRGASWIPGDVPFHIPFPKPPSVQLSFQRISS